MKITVDSGERATVIVPSRHPSSAQVSIETEGGKVVDVVVEDGLISNVYEHVSRRRESVRDDDRLMLWAHLVSEHASCLGFDLPLATLIEIHDHEHVGPGTIRNHDRASRKADTATLVHVLGEAESGVPAMTDSQFRLHYQIVAREAKRRSDDADARAQADAEFAAASAAAAAAAPEAEADDDPYEGSFCEAADNEGARIAAQSREGGDD